MAANDNIRHPLYFDIMTEFGDDPLMRHAVRGLSRKFCDNLYWFMRFEQAMLNWEVNYNRAKIKVME